MHQQVTINENAPVLADAAISIHADAETIWHLLVSAAEWPTWNPDIKSVSIADPLKEGMTFKWQAGPGSITSTVQRAIAPSLLVWTGKTMGLKAVHVYQIDRVGQETIVRTRESWEGWPARFFPKKLQTALDESLERGLQFLKKEAEHTAETKTGS